MMIERNEGKKNERMGRRSSAVTLRTNRGVDWYIARRENVTTAHDRNTKERTDGKTNRGMEGRVEERGVRSSPAWMVGGWIIFLISWVLMLLPRLFVFVKDKRKHTDDVPVEKMSKKYKVGERKKVGEIIAY